MKRILFHQLLKWRDKKYRKPLILKGARQVGKTYLLKEFGEKCFEKFHYFNFEKQEKELHKIFETDFDSQRILNELSLLKSENINPKKDLLILDEIQNCPRALTSLKYFCEEMPYLAVCAAGSLLGLGLSDTSFPVGKVEFLELYPMNFEEFLYALKKEMLMDVFDKALKKKTIPGVAHDQFCNILKNYYVVGGMPESVKIYLSEQNSPLNAFLKVRETQSNIIKTYINDFSKHSGKENALHLVRVYNNVPEQLSKNVDDSVKRYRFRSVIPNKRGFSALEGPIDWLEKAGLIIKVKICNNAQMPLKAFSQYNLFKLFISDIGLLGCMMEIEPRALIQQDYGMTKGFFTENFVAQELLASGMQSLYSWMHRNSEIEFLMQKDSEIIPIEVKAGYRTKAQSLRQYLLRYKPNRSIKMSLKNLDLNSQPNSVPLYLSGRINRNEGFTSF